MAARVFSLRRLAPNAKTQLTLFSTTQSFAYDRRVYGIFIVGGAVFFSPVPGRDSRDASENRAAGDTFPRHLEICVAPRR